MTAWLFKKTIVSLSFFSAASSFQKFISLRRTETMPTIKPMMVITSTSSISVKPLDVRPRFLCVIGAMELRSLNYDVAVTARSALAAVATE